MTEQEYQDRYIRPALETWMAPPPQILDPRNGGVGLSMNIRPRWQRLLRFPMSALFNHRLGVPFPQAVAMAWRFVWWVPFSERYGFRK